MKLSLTMALALVVAVEASAQDSIDYLRQVKPVLQARCWACHGALKQEGGLRLDTAAAAVKGGDSGAAIKVGESASSLLLKRVTSTDDAERMPPEGEPLTKTQIAAIAHWIQQGAKAPADEHPERAPRDHWAFQLPARSGLPTVKDAKWVKNPIDAFVLAKLEAQQLRPQHEADRRTLLRRVSLDLVGLPPSLEEQDAFLADQSSDAYERAVDRLLASQHYGERWGRHFMDLWRYSDWWGLGAEVRNSQKHIWHWRDWIVDSLNADKGYDQMIREMLAADELYPQDLDRLRGTGFLARQYFKFNRTTWLDDTIEHTAKAFLGLTLNCAKCHDHKYDPVSQIEYYQLRAFFEPYQIRTDLIPGESNFEKNGIPRAFDCNLEAVTHLHVRGDDRNPDKSRLIEPKVPAFLSRDDFQIQTVSLPLDAYQPGLREFVIETQRAAAARAISEAKANLHQARQDLAVAEASRSKSLAAEKTSLSKPTPLPASVGTVVVQDTFAVPQPEVWQTLGGEWTHADGKLIQSKTGATRCALRLKKPAPQDFEVKLKFVTTGGEQWKSVGVAFDVNERHEKVVYMSCYAGGPKLQVSYKDTSGQHYPTNGMLARDVKLGTVYELGVKVQGQLINVAIDGKQALAYRLPSQREKGEFDVISFDAAVAFLGFELKELPPDAALVTPEGSPPAASSQSYEHAVATVRVAEQTLAAAELDSKSIEARVAADRAKFAQPPLANFSELAKQAAHLEKSAALAEAEVGVTRAELALSQTMDGKRADLEKKLAAAKTLLEAAKKTAVAPGENYSSLRGALKTLENNLETEASRSKPFPMTSTGRRTALATWIASNQNPLTARVLVNHLWSRHTGKPIVTTVFDFGRKGAAPSHPELLDWLAVELMEHHWSVKHLHRLIVTSNTYRQSSSTVSDEDRSLTIDPDNKLVWHMHPIRMESQIVRDSLLALSGELDGKIGGPTVPANDESSKRRSLYFTHSNNDQNRFLAMFDDAKVQECYRRAESVVPQQALALENSRLASRAAELVAAKIAASTAEMSDQEFIRRAFITVLATEPTSAEREECVAALAEWTKLLMSAPDKASKARVRLVLALFNHNDFVTIR